MHRKIKTTEMLPPNSYNTKDMSEEELEEKLKEGLQITYRRVVEQHRRDNQPLIFCENGVVTQVDPFTVSI